MVAKPGGSADLAEALQQLVDIVRQDGADLRLLKCTRDGVELQLDTRDATCAECVMPKHFLEAVVLSALQESVPWVREVTIRDPREDGDATATPVDT